MLGNVILPILYPLAILSRKLQENEFKKYNCLNVDLFLKYLSNNKILKQNIVLESPIWDIGRLPEFASKQNGFPILVIAGKNATVCSSLLGREDRAVTVLHSWNFK
ncbi:hypothetical protein BES34_016940 [Leptospira inadai serovar Lyme]|uniref:Uncharacterized protein n=1 Tax=Leptospira inadai serovar Lyme TaxID=293084 RepID=A0ABX4YF32_9LEPT|nr:hypothetical protein BES34_016940 [Leptospira inadai serovar Lyme]